MTARRTIVTACTAAALAFGAGLIAAPILQPEQPEMDPAMVAWMTPDEHHAALEPLIGEWKGSVKFWMAPEAEPMESVGTVTREWIMDGRFVVEHVVSSMPEGEGEFHGMGIMGYNTVEKTYESFWIENMATYMAFAKGTVDGEKHQMIFEGEMLDPMSGQRLNTRFEMDTSNPRRHVSVGYTTGPDGKEFKSFEGVMERRR